jgi:hypothetical protein
MEKVFATMIAVSTAFNIVLGVNLYESRSSRNELVGITQECIDGWNKANQSLKQCAQIVHECNREMGYH